MKTQFERGGKLGSGGTRLYSQHLGGRGRQISEFKASQVYKVSSRTARAIQRNPISKNKNKNKKERGGKLSQVTSQKGQEASL